jgi:anti-anti-sigma factor
MADRVCAVRVTSDAGSVTAHLTGEFDLAAVAEVREALALHLHRHVTVDMREVGFVDSSGIHCLLRLREEAARQGGRVTLHTISPAVRRVLDIVGVTGQLAVEP